MHPFLDLNSIEETPLVYLRRVGDVFAEFGPASGNVAYGLRIGDERFFVKTAGDPDDAEPFLGWDARVAVLRNAAPLAQSCAHPAMPKLFRMIESPAGPVLVYEWVDGDLVGAPTAERDDPASAFQRFLALPTEAIARCLDVLYELHRDLARAGWVAVDLYDGSLIYNFDKARLRVIDLADYHRGPFINVMGRMFGSSRFMAPEEFQRGAMIDERTNVFVLGRFAAVFLGGGVLTPDTFRGTPAMFEVVARACEREPVRRFDSMVEFHQAWTAARRR